ncbi:MAG: TldD/PmbA family protein [Mycoplasma sp.]|nr:TldD/PmbA family protein [Mycoplasma sp.]
MKTNFKLINEYAKSKGINGLQMHSSYSLSEEMEFEGGTLKKSEANISINTSLIGIMKNRKVFTGIESNDLNKLKEKIDDLLYISKYTTKETEEELISPKGLIYPKVDPKIFNIEKRDTNSQIELLKELNDRMNKLHKNIKSETTIAALSYSFSDFKMENTNGLELEKQSKVMNIVGVLFLDVDGNKITIIHGEKIINDKDWDIDKFINKIDKKIKERVKKSKIESGKYKTILSNRAFSTLVSQYFSHFNARSVIDERSIYKDDLGKKIMSEKITIVDEGVNIKGKVFSTFDADGMPTQRKEIVKNGVLKTFLHNIKSAKIMNVKTTGNSAGDNPSGFFTYILPGEKTKEQLFSKVDNGFMITSFKGLHSGLNSISGDFSLEIEGFKIKDGKQSDFVTGAIATGNYFEIIKNIKNLSSELNFDEAITPYARIIDLDIA